MTEEQAVYGGSDINPGTGHSRACQCDACTEYWNRRNDHAKTKYDPKSRYYDHGGIEVLEIIKAKLTPEQYQGFCLGNAIKYTCRANHKGDYDRDLEKAEFYTREAR